MKTKVSRVGPVAVLEVQGKITVGLADLTLRDEVNELLDAGERNIVIDLERATWMDSTGLGELVFTYKRVKERGGIVKLVVPQNSVLYTLLSDVRLNQVVPVFNSKPEAVASFRDGSTTR